MRLPSASCLAILATALLASTMVSAQPGPTPSTVMGAECRAEETSLLQEMEIARARGRMLQRRQLATELEAVQARCGTLPPTQSREAAIQRLQSEIRELRKELDRAETELRQLQQGR